MALSRGRAAVLDALRGETQPLGIDELARRVGRHPNTVREQVTWLVREGYAERVHQPTARRGRPAWLYRAL